MEFFLSLISGGATGLIGTVLSGAVKFFADRENHKHELSVMEMEGKMMDREAEIAKEIKALDMSGKQAQAAWRGLEASYGEAGKRWSTGESGWIVGVDVVRGLMRPLLTLGLVVLVGVIYFTIAEGDPDTKNHIIATILYLASMATTWWFGSRSITKKLPTQKG